MARDLLSRPGPDGSYVIPVRAAPGLAELLRERDLAYEEIGGYIIVKTRSRSAAKKLLEELLARGYVIEPPY